MLSSNNPDGGQKNRLRMQLIIMESDFRKNEKIIVECEMDLRRLKRKKDLLNLEISEKDTNLKRLRFKQMEMMKEIKVLKKKAS